MGGLAGGLYGLFNVVGKSFYSLLIGKMRAEHSQLNKKRVRAGGCLTFIFIGAVVFLLTILPELLNHKRNVSDEIGYILLGGFLTGIIGWCIAVFLNGYVQDIERETERAKRKTPKG